jgi:hypothetical protein
MTDEGRKQRQRPERRCGDCGGAVTHTYALWRPGSDEPRLGLGKWHCRAECKGRRHKTVVVTVLVREEKRDEKRDVQVQSNAAVSTQ